MNGRSNVPRPRIALVEWTWTGHHPTYFNHLVLALEETGVGVLALCPEPEEAERTANRARRPDANVAGRTEFKKFTSPEWKFGRLKPRWIGGWHWSLRHFTGVERVIREWSGTVGERVDAIFFACMYAWDFEYMRAIQPFLRLPWMGLYIHALPYRIPGQTHSRLGHTVPRPHSMFGGALCRGIAILDEGIVEKVSTSIGRPVAVFPDVPDERPAATDEERKRGDDLKRFANGRPVIGLVGHLHQSKGVGTFLETIRALPEDGLCFALAGEVWGGPDGELSRQVQRTLSERTNLWTHLERLPDEPHLNHLLAACDVIVAAYWDFPHSSGIQSKAAALKKPVIVSDGHLMAERSRRYHLGEVVPQKDALALGAAIQKLTGGAKSSATTPRWEEYRQAHSFDRLKSGLKELLGQI